MPGGLQGPAKPFEQNRRTANRNIQIFCFAAQATTCTLCFISCNGLPGLSPPHN